MLHWEFSTAKRIWSSRAAQPMVATGNAARAVGNLGLDGRRSRGIRLSRRTHLIPGVAGVPVARQRSLVRIGVGPYAAGNGAHAPEEVGLRDSIRSATGRRSASCLKSHQDHGVGLQLGEIERGQQLRRQGELAQEVSHATFEKRLRAMDNETFAQVTSPVSSRIKTGTHQTLAVQVREDLLPETSTAAFRRTARPHGPIARRMVTPDSPTAPAIPVSRVELRDATPDSLAESTRRSVDMASMTTNGTQDGADTITNRFEAAISDLQVYHESLRASATTPPGTVQPLNTATSNSSCYRLDPNGERRRLHAQLNLASTNGAKADRRSGGLPR